MNHGHPDGDLLTSILAYEWLLENKRHYNQKYTDWRTSWTREWNACTKVGLMHHVLVAIHDSIIVLQHMFNEHKHAFPEAPKRHFGSPGYSTLLLHSVWTAFFEESVPYSHCAWCKETPKTRGMLEEHYYDIHHVVLQPSCCAPPSVFQTIMGMELQLRQTSFGPYSKSRVFLREKMQYEEATDILGATCAVQEDKAKVWYVKILPDQDDPTYWFLKRGAHECKYGGPASTMNFWELSSFTDRLTLGVKMHSTAAFLSVPNKDGIIMGGRSTRGFNDKTVRGYSSCCLSLLVRFQMLSC